LLDLNNLQVGQADLGQLQQTASLNVLQAENLSLFWRSPEL
jgi:hypothetical protein